MLETPLATWISAHFKERSNPPFSFVYGGKPSETFISSWNFASHETRIDEERVTVTSIYHDPVTQLSATCVCTLFKMQNAIEWVLHFKNEGKVDTPIIEDIRSIDVDIIDVPPGHSCILHRALGSNAQRNDFMPIADLFDQNKTVELFPIGGRSSNTSVFPFFNIEEKGRGGIFMAIGWSGQWVSFFQRNDRGMHVRAGLDVARLKLHPGEQIRAPRILLVPWKGADRIASHNQFRRLLLQFYVPKKDGKPVQLPIANSACRDQKFGDEANKFTEQNQLEMIGEMKQFGLDCVWIDAGWFEGRWPNGVGSWTPRKDGFPRGLHPVGAAARDAGMGFVLWFEPERVHDGSWLHKNHPEWLLKIPGTDNHLLNLGNDEARRWLTDHVSGIISDACVTIYRHDFNIEPWVFWERGDEPDREGMTEIRYIEGFYKYWDELLRRHPGLVIDNCASGGRRIDLETISRSVALWRSDYQYFEPIGQQCMTYGLGLYLPPTSTGTKFTDPYKFRSAMTCGLAMNINPFLPDFKKGELQARLKEFKRIRALYYGDFYPLTPYSTEDDCWMAYQFHRDDLKSGMILAFRRDKAKNASMKLVPKGLGPSTLYKVEFIDEGIEKSIPGATILEGMDIKIKKAPGTSLVVYSWQ
nr:alpha-galactosidase [Candidatus Sigynarchaeota archaeon]